MKKTLSILLVLMMVLSLAACGGNTTSDTPSAPVASETPSTPAATTPSVSTETTTQLSTVEEGTNLKKDVVIGMDAACLTMDVQAITATSDFTAHKLIHENLFKLDPETREYNNWLCESYEMDGADWTLHLRKGIKFHNGSEFTANDVYYTLITRGQVSPQTSSFCQDLTADVIDDYTIHVNTKTVNMDFIARMAHVTYGMLSKDACEQDPDHGFEIGTGAYKFVELFENSYAKFEKNENYWGDEPYAETIELRYYSEPSARLIALQNGEIDVCMGPASTELDYVREDPNLDLIEIVGAKSLYITFNTEKEPYNNLEFRQACAYAIDDQAVIDIVVDGLGTISNSTYGPNSAVNCDSELKGYEYNPEKAKELIEKNGWTGTTINILSNDGKNDAKTTETIQSMLQAVGLNVNIEKRGAAEVTAARSAGDIEMMVGQFGSSDYPDGVKINCSSTGSYNFARFKDPEIDAMLDEGLTIEDWNERKAIYTRVQQIVFDEMCYYYPIFRENANVAVAKGVGGFYVRCDFVTDFTYIQVPER